MDLRERERERKRISLSEFESKMYVIFF